MMNAFLKCFKLILKNLIRGQKVFKTIKHRSETLKNCFKFQKVFLPHKNVCLIFGKNMKLYIT